MFHGVIREGGSGSVFLGRVEVLGFEFEYELFSEQRHVVDCWV
jgi:hypothetical protein